MAEREFDPGLNIYLAQQANKYKSYILFALMVDDKGYRLACPLPTRQWLRNDPVALKACEEMVMSTLKEVVEKPMDDLNVAQGRPEDEE